MKISLRTTVILISFFITGFLKAQVVTTDPYIPAADQYVTIIFDATQGSGGLQGFEGDVYAHTGVLTENSTAPNDWKYVQAGWGVNIPKCKMTWIDDDLYELQIGPNIRDYYGVPDGEEILQMAFVFRSATEIGGNWLEGKTETGGDIFIDVFKPGLNLLIIQPGKPSLIAEQNDTITVEAASSSANTLSLLVNNELTKQAEGNYISDSLVASEFGTYWVKLIAENDTGAVADSFYYYVRQPVTENPLPEGIIEGINYMSDTSVILCLYAPEKEFVFALGDFNDWQPGESSYMFRTPGGDHYWIEINGLEPGQEYIYQYYVDGEILIGDPYAEKVSDPWNDSYITESIYPGLIDYPAGKTSGVATVLQTAQEEYQWEVTDFTPPAKKDLLVYEMLIRDFTHAHTYLSLIDTLDYFERLGINAIELMPVNEFEGNISWGYNPSYYFAPDKYYGPKHTLQMFIDECHKRGIAVILDVVFNHSFGQSPMVMLYWNSDMNRPAANNPWYNEVPKHDFNVGYDINHESEDTRRFFERVMTHWITRYKVDGFRFDLSKGFTQNNTLGNPGAMAQYDASRITILKHYADTIWELDEDFYVILEHFADNSEETELANYGMMIWGNENGKYIKASSGWNLNSDFSWISHKTRGWNYPHLIGYMESHDEERLMHKAIESGNNQVQEYNIRDTSLALERMGLAATFLFTIPGPKMMWQFGEIGYDYTIDYNGRTGPKPIRWDYLDDYRRKYLFDVYSSLIKLKREYGIFNSDNFSLSLSGDMKKISLLGAPMSAIVLGNFGVETGSINPSFYHPGKWYEYFAGDSIVVSDINEQILLQPGEYRIYTDIRIDPPGLNTSVDDMSILEKIAFVYPNPSDNGCFVAFELESLSEIEINIYNVMGQKIKNLFRGSLLPGAYKYFWNHTDGMGTEVKKGIYFYELISDNHRESGKIVVR